MIISLSGHMKSGKDTVGKMIQLLSENYNDSDIILIVSGNLPEWRSETKYRQWEIKKFAFKVKEVASILTGIPVKDLDKQEVKEQILGEEWWFFDNEDFLCSPDVRWLLQRIGLEAIRNQIHPNAWVNALFADYKENHPITPYQNWIITDTRFPNEVKAIKDRNGILIRINRDWRLSAVTDLENGGTANDFIDDQLNKINEHPSETALDDYKDWNHVIDNNGSLEDLLVKVKEIYNQIKKR